MRKSSIELRHQWEERIQKQKASGLLIQLWCKENQVGPYLFHYWKKRIFRKTLSRDNFIEIVDAKDAGIALEVNNIRVCLAKDFDPITLQTLLRSA